MGNNLLNNRSNVVLKILFFSADNRQSDFIDYHNKNIQEYCKKYKYNYIFHNLNYKNVPIYWSKLLYCRDHLYTHKYDYVVWMDTDSMIIDDNIDIGILIQNLGGDIIIGYDYFSTILNAGIFIIKNSHIGRKFIKQCVDELKDECVDSTGSYTLGETWAGVCYEQGKMNNLINTEYSKYTKIIPTSFLKNTHACLKDTFILHKIGPKDDIMQCFENGVKPYNLYL